MMEVFTETLRSWQNFYFMVGGAAAGLMGLMFVALSLGSHLVSDETIRAFPAFVTPSIIYFVSVLLVAAVMLAPTFTAVAIGVLFLAGGALGLLRTSWHVRQLIRLTNQHQNLGVWYWLWQVILPLASYGLIALSGLLFVFDQWAPAFTGLWLAELAILLCAIANTWGLVVWIIQQGRP
jgi:hypothetical protein